MLEEAEEGQVIGALAGHCRDQRTVTTIDYTAVAPDVIAVLAEAWQISPALDEVGRRPADLCED